MLDLFSFQRYRTATTVPQDEDYRCYQTPTVSPQAVRERTGLDFIYCYYSPPGTWSNPACSIKESFTFNSVGCLIILPTQQIAYFDEPPLNNTMHIYSYSATDQKQSASSEFPASYFA